MARGKGKAASDDEGWATVKLFAVCWSTSLNCPAFLCMWETGQLSWVPLLSLGSNLIDACLWANRLLFTNPVKTSSFGRLRA